MKIKLFINGLQFSIARLLPSFIISGITLMNSIGVKAQTWCPPLLLETTTGTGGATGKFSSLLIVNGNPAIAYIDETHSNVMFLRANDALGITWGTPVAIDVNQGLGEYTSLQIVNGNPAVSYYDQLNKDLKFVRATNASGSAWGTPVSIDVTGDVGKHTSLQIVNGNPAITYYNGTNSTLDLKYVRANDVSGSAWGTPITIDVNGVVGEYTSLQIINGNPAVSYYDAINRDLKFVRATDASGSTWGTPISIDVTVDVGKYTSLQIVNGNPAVSYYDETNKDLKYIRATDASGSVWGTPISIDVTGFVGEYTSLQIVNGNPTVSYYDATNKDLKFVSATDASGSSWGTPFSVDGTADVGKHASLQIVNGMPAVSYFDETNKDLKYVHATDVSGSTWDSPIAFDVAGPSGESTSLQFVNGMPAVSYFDHTNGDLKYIRANDASGSTWGTPVSVDVTGFVGYSSSLQIVDGMPAISYCDGTNADLKYVRAVDISGSSWGTPISIDVTGIVGQNTSLQIVNGMPAIAYYDQTNGNLKYIRALDATGNTWGTPVAVDVAGDLGKYTNSLQIVNGLPAIAYFDYTNGDLKYIRAIDASGSAWGPPIAIDVTGDVGRYVSLQIVNGNPAISYDGPNILKYIRATDISGGTWGSPVTIATDITSSFGMSTSLEIVNGLPAVSYFSLTTNDLKYVRAIDSSGSIWSTPVSLDLIGFGGGHANASMVSTSSGVGIAYYNAYEGSPSFIGTFVTVISSQPSNSSICSGSNTTFSVSAAGLTYQWQEDQGGGFINLANGAPYSNVTTATLSITNSTTNMNGYLYRCQVTSSCSSPATSNNATLTVTANSAPIVTANATATIVCANPATSVTLTGGGAASYVWSGGVTDGVGFIPTSTSTYTVTGTDGGGCTNTATTTITVNSPIVSANATASSVCAGTLVTVTGGGAISYSWSGGVTDGISFIPSSTTTYTVTGTDINSCTNTATKTIIVNNLPAVIAHATAINVCIGTAVTLTGGGAISYVWSGGVTNGIGFIPASSATYTVTGTDGNGCTDTTSLTITVNPPPVVSANASETIVCGGTTVTLTGSGAVSYVWTGGVTNGIGFIPPATAIYSVTGTDANGCSDTATVTVTVNTWSDPVLVETLTGTGGHTGLYTSLATINGKPAISYYDETRKQLMFVIASNISGSAWNNPVTIYGTGFFGKFSSLQDVDGLPAVAYYDPINYALTFIRAIDSSGTAWGNPLIIDASTDVGQHASLQMVNGKPAVSYYDNSNQNLKYIRSLDASGSAWGSPVIIDATGDVGQYSSLVVVNGNPAVSYYDYTNFNLKYKRATDPTGNTWGAAVSIDVTGDVGRFTSMQIINGNPAIAYSDATNSKLKYVRATNVSGSSWGLPANLDGTYPNMVGQYISLQVVNGNPAVSYYDFTYANSYLKYIRSNDVSGSTWNAPVVIDYVYGVGKYNSLQIINGRPAVSYYDETNGNLKYNRANDISGNIWGNGISIDVTGDVGLYTSYLNVKGKPAISYYDFTNSKLRYKRAMDTTGSVWGNPIILNTTGNGGSSNSLQIVNNNPAISYFGGNDDLLYVHALDSLGNSWTNPIIIDNAGQAGHSSSLLVVNGMPAIAYRDITSSNLKYVRATDASGNNWGPPVTVDNSVNDVGTWASLQIVNGMPAISYFDATFGKLKYVRATDASGSSWGIPISLEQIGTIGSSTTLQIVKGNPAISYYKSSDGELKYVRANNASGTSWGNPVIVDNSSYDIGLHASLQIVRGMPAISYYDAFNKDLIYKRATDSLGSAWSAPVALDVIGDVGKFTSMYSTLNGVGITYYNVTEGLPAFVYWNFSIIINSQPSNSSVCTGSDATFSVTASCAGLTYQWQEDQGLGFVNLINSTQYNNVTTPTLTIANANASLSGYLYRCQVTGIYSSIAISNAAVLTVSTLSVPIVNANATATTVCAGAQVTLTGGGTATSYVWSGGITDGVAFIPTSNTTYIVTGSGSSGCTDTASITITVNSINVNANATDTIVCAGINTFVTLAGVGAASYVWSGGVTNGVGFIPISTATYTVTGTDVNSCVDTATITITVSPQPVLVITNPTVVCSPTTIDISSSIVTVGSSGGTISYWLDSLATVPLNATYYTAIDSSGTYYLKLNSAECFDTKPVTVNISNHCVWPGDTNNDSIADNYDLLPIGLFYSQIGTSRSNISNTWQAYPSIDWGTPQINGADIKHVDCNGNGIIDSNDTLAINLNFSSIHALIANNFNDLKLLNPDIYFVTSSSSYFAGDWIDVEIWTGSSTIPVSNLYGIAFNIDYDVSLVQAGTESLTYSNSWLGIPGTNAIKISKIDAFAAKAHGGISRINHTNASGYGKIANFKFRTNTSITSSSDLHLSISRYEANDVNGLPLVFNTSTDSITIIPLTTSLKETNTVSEFTISPNPFTLNTTITFSKDQKNTIIKIMDVLSKEIKKINFTGKHLIIEKGEMEAGIYFVQITDENNCVENRKIVIQ